MNLEQSCKIFQYLNFFCYILQDIFLYCDALNYCSDSKRECDRTRFEIIFEKYFALPKEGFLEILMNSFPNLAKKKKTPHLKLFRKFKLSNPIFLEQLTMDAKTSKYSKGRCKEKEHVKSIPTFC